MKVNKVLHKSYKPDAAKPVITPCNTACQKFNSSKKNSIPKNHDVQTKVTPINVDISILRNGLFLINVNNFIISTEKIHKLIAINEKVVKPIPRDTVG